MEAKDGKGVEERWSGRSVAIGVDMSLVPCVPYYKSVLGRTDIREAGGSECRYCRGRTVLS